MQKKEMTIPTSKNDMRLFSLLSPAALTSWLEQQTVFRRIAALYSFLLEMEVTPRQAVCCFYAQVALVVVLFPYSCVGTGWRLFFLSLCCQALRSAFGTVASGKP